MMSRAGWHKAFISIVSPAQCHDLVPYMKCDDLLGGLFTPGNTYIND